MVQPMCDKPDDLSRRGRAPVVAARRPLSTERWEASSVTLRRLGASIGGREDDLAAQFDANRVRRPSVAYRMLGSTTEAEDAVQEMSPPDSGPVT